MEEDEKEEVLGEVCMSAVFIVSDSPSYQAETVKVHITFLFLVIQLMTGFIAVSLYCS